MRARLTVIGAGRAGSALAVLLARRGWKVAAIVSSRRESARRLARRCGAGLATTDPLRGARAADAILIAVPDRKIGGVARTLATLGDDRGNAGGRDRGRAPGRIVLHTSGASGSEILSPLKEAPRQTPAGAASGARRGWTTGSFHPLVAFPPVARRPGQPPPAEPRLDLRGVTVAIDGDPEARRLARALAASLGARVLELRAGQRARYHLAACFASNYTITLASEAEQLLIAAGLSKKEALAALLPLLRSTLANLETAGLPDALTGPVARGDDATVGRHAALLRRAPVELRALHRAIVRSTARLALSAHRIDARALRRIERALAPRS